MTSSVASYTSNTQANSIGLLRRLAGLGIIMTFVVIVLGAYVRLSDAGLGCPDWPGCFGQVFAPSDADAIAAAAAAYPNVEVDSGKAWKEMIHRYLASGLGLVVVIMWLISFKSREVTPFRWISFLLALICFQGALGMWTVTKLLQPTIVTAHLLGGMSVLATFAYLYIKMGANWVNASQIKLNRIVTVLMFATIAQIALGGWTSTNYTGLHCPDFPTCQGQWLPETDFKTAFTLTAEEGVNYEGGRLGNTASVTVHLTHRLGAVVVFLLALTLLFAAIKEGNTHHRKWAYILFAVVFGQWALGITTVLLHLPVAIATAHNAGAALLLLSVIRYKHLVHQGAS